MVDESPHSPVESVRPIRIDTAGVKRCVADGSADHASDRPEAAGVPDTEQSIEWVVTLIARSATLVNGIDDQVRVTEGAKGDPA